MTRYEVRAARQTPAGCCERYANNQACDCLDIADFDSPYDPRHLDATERKLLALALLGLAVRQAPSAKDAIHIRLVQLAHKCGADKEFGEAARSYLASCEGKP